MPASPDRLAQVDAQLEALGVDEDAARSVVARLLERRLSGLEEVDAALARLAEGLELPAPSAAAPSESASEPDAPLAPDSAAPELPLAEQEPERSTDELSLEDLALEDLELPSEEMLAAAPASSVPPPVPSEPAPASSVPPPVPSAPASSVPPPVPSEPAPPVPSAPASSVPPPVPSEPAPASSVPPPVPSAPAPSAGLDADSLFGEMGEVSADAGLELELDAIADDGVEPFAFEDEGGEATGLFTADDIAAIQSQPPPSSVGAAEADDDFDLLIDDGELDDLGLEEIILEDDAGLADAAAAADVGAEDTPVDDADPEKKEGGFFKKLFG